MQMVVSQAWTIDAEEHAEAYIAKSRAMDAFLAAQPGFVARTRRPGVQRVTDLVLLHGAFRGAWSWQRVVPFLQSVGRVDAGHPAA